MSFHRFDLLHIFVAGFVLTLIFSLVAWIYHLAAKGINKFFEGPSAETKKTRLLERKQPALERKQRALESRAEAKFLNARGFDGKRRVKRAKRFRNKSPKPKA